MGAPGSDCVMLSGLPSPSTADCRPWRCGFVLPRAPFTIGTIAEREERALFEPAPGAEVLGEGATLERRDDVDRRVRAQVVHGLPAEEAAQRAQGDAALRLVDRDDRVAAAGVVRDVRGVQDDAAARCNERAVPRVADGARRHLLGREALIAGDDDSLRPEIDGAREPQILACCAGRLHGLRAEGVLQPWRRAIWTDVTARGSTRRLRSAGTW